MERLFPKEFLNAMADENVSGSEAMKNLEQIQEMRDYVAPNSANSHSASKGARPAIKRGIDNRGLPYLEVDIPQFVPLFYYTHFNCEKEGFVDYKNWLVGYADREQKTVVSFSMNYSSSKDPENAIKLLSQIMKKEDCTETRQSVVSTKDRNLVYLS